MLLLNSQSKVGFTRFPIGSRRSAHGPKAAALAQLHWMARMGPLATCQFSDLWSGLSDIVVTTSACCT